MNSFESCWDQFMEDVCLYYQKDIGEESIAKRFELLSNASGKPNLFLVRTRRMQEHCFFFPDFLRERVMTLISVHKEPVYVTQHNNGIESTSNS